jgi:hypothetical protein
LVSVFLAAATCQSANFSNAPSDQIELAYQLDIFVNRLHLDPRVEVALLGDRATISPL